MPKNGRNFRELLKLCLIKQPFGRLLQMVIQRLEDHRTRLVNECLSRMPY
jgi:hypothetical protein